MMPPICGTAGYVIAASPRLVLPIWQAQSNQTGAPVRSDCRGLQHLLVFMAAVAQPREASCGYA